MGSALELTWNFLHGASVTVAVVSISVAIVDAWKHRNVWRVAVRVRLVKVARYPMGGQFSTNLALETGVRCQSDSQLHTSLRRQTKSTGEGDSYGAARLAAMTDEEVEWITVPGPYLGDPVRYEEGEDPNAED